jgi:hypothetical protein
MREGQHKRGARAAKVAWATIGWAALASACGAADRPETIPVCEGEVCNETAVGSTARTTTGDGAVPREGTGGLPELAPPAGAPAEGLGIPPSIAAGNDIGLQPTVGVDGRQRVPPGVVTPGGAPALPGPPGALTPAPGAAVDPVTGLAPPQEGVGGVVPGTVVPGQPTVPVGPAVPEQGAGAGAGGTFPGNGTVPVAPREPTEDDFVF